MWRVYNAALEMRNEHHAKTGKELGITEQRRHFGAIRNKQAAAGKAGDPDPGGLVGVNATCLYDTVARTDIAFAHYRERRRDYFTRLKAKQLLSQEKAPERPGRRKEHKFHSLPFSAYGPQCRLVRLVRAPGSGEVVGEQEVILGDMPTDPDRKRQKELLSGHKLQLLDLGLIRVVLHRPVLGRIKTVTVKFEGERWYVIFSCDLGDVAPPPNGKPPVGIDLGLTHFIATSDDYRAPPIQHLKAALAEIRRLNRKVALHWKQKKPKRREYPAVGSRRFELNWRKLRRLHARVTNLRKDAHYKLALGLVRQYGLIACEALNIRGMLRHHTLARAISDAAWGNFVGVLKQQGEKYGAIVRAVNPHGTSQECSGCGAYVKKDLSVRIHDCPHCGLKIDRDVNAARCILKRAMAEIEEELRNPPKPAKPKTKLQKWKRPRAPKQVALEAQP